MAYQSLYRRWRPQTFAQVVGQQHIVRTLANGLKTGRIGHAYLFAGPRGTGKTSMARLLAKGLNCVEGPTPEPCNVCDNCRRIAEGSSVDVMEIDGASNRGIDEVRELRENVKFAATQGSYKIYIIDEVHMLTTDAFNALLKTLEEPPEHVVFVLATTEVHKVPATIMSRCQRFDFRRFSLGEITGRLEEVLRAEDISWETGALDLIARHGEGSLRDALGILDQCIAYADETGLTMKVVLEALGTVDRERIANFAHLIIEGDLVSILGEIKALEEEGKDLGQFLKELIGHWRDLLVIGAGKGDLADVPEGIMPQMEEQSRRLPVARTLQILKICTDTLNELRWSTHNRISLEMAMLKAAVPTEPALDLKEQLAQLEKRVAALEKGSPVEQAVVEQPGSVPRGEAPEKPRKEELKPVEPQGQVPLEPSKDSPRPVEQEVPAQLDDWEALLENFRKAKRVDLQALLREGRPVSFQDGLLVVEFPEDKAFHKASLEQGSNREFAEKVFSRLLGGAVKLELCFAEERPEAATKDNGGILDEPAVKAAMELFGGKVIKVIDED
ncbi:MAG: DNA polymerase III subunit gamma/tau [Limnochordia bacterium]|jgi:DNA polymerase-3 subunit gamma/tau